MRPFLDSYRDKFRVTEQKEPLYLLPDEKLRQTHYPTYTDSKSGIYTNIPVYLQSGRLSQTYAAIILHESVVSRSSLLA